MQSDDISVTVLDDDAAGIVVAPVATNLSEADGSATFTVALSSESIDAVVLSITTDGQSVITPTQLTFTDLNWDSQQTVTVVGVDDNVAEGKHSSTISHTISGRGPGDFDRPAGIVTARVADNEALRMIDSLIETVTGLIPRKTEEQAAASQPADQSAEASEVSRRLSPTHLLVAVVGVLVIFAPAVEMASRR
jgi:hypothetical protein